MGTMTGVMRGPRDTVMMADYADRLGYAGPLAVDFAMLSALHAHHLRKVPFENLDIYNKRPINLDIESLKNKIIKNKRGGFCYELNGLFYIFLKEIGFNVQMIAANVARDDGSFGPDFDHLALIVRLDEPFLVDVGFGSAFLTPLRLNEPGIQTQSVGSFQLACTEGRYTLFMKTAGACDAAAQYRFTLTPQPLSAFAEMSRFHQTSPLSHFTQKRLCTRATPDGRVTISQDRLIETGPFGRRETPLTSEQAVRTALATHFEIVL